MGTNVRFFSREEINAQRRASVLEPVVEEGSYRVWEDGGFFGHMSDFPCPICRRNMALFNNTLGTMEPCTACRLRGYHTILLKSNTPFVRWILSKFIAFGSVPIISDDENIDNRR